MYTMIFIKLKVWKRFSKQNGYTRENLLYLYAKTKDKQIQQWWDKKVQCVTIIAPALSGPRQWDHKSHFKGLKVVMSNVPCIHQKMSESHVQLRAISQNPFSKSHNPKPASALFCSPHWYTLFSKVLGALLQVPSGRLTRLWDFSYSYNWSFNTVPKKHYWTLFAASWGS